MGKAKASSDDTSNQAADGGGGADPGMGVAGPRADAERAAGQVPAGQQRIQLSGAWTNRATGQDHEAMSWITVDDQLARDLNTAGYVVRGGDGAPLTFAQSQAREQARRAHAEGAQDGTGAASDGDATAGAKGDDSK